MFKQKNRLTKQKDFDRVFKTGFSSFDKIVGVKVLKNNLGYNRFGTIVGKKISNKAVTRNKVKRKIREVLKKYNHVIQQGFDIVVIALPPAEDVKYLEFRFIIEKHFRKVRLFNV